MDLIRKWILLADSYRWNVIEIAIHDVDNFCRCLLQALLHR